MSSNDLTLAALVGSRICHDLISPVGAILNGLELLHLAGTQGAGPEMSLVADSASHARARIRFFRVAFGLASADQEISTIELTSVLRDAYTGKVALDWQVEGDLSRSDAQLAFLALMCAEQAIPMGGSLTISGRNGRLLITGTGPKISPRPEHWAILTAPDGTYDVPASQVQFAMLPILLDRQERQPHYQFSDSEVALQI